MHFVFVKAEDGIRCWTVPGVQSCSLPIPGKDQTNAAAANSVANRAGSTASAATQTAESTLDNGFNANLMLAKIGDTNYRLGQMSEASTAYFMMNVKKPESAGAKVTRRFGGLNGNGRRNSTRRGGGGTPPRLAT